MPRAPRAPTSARTTPKPDKKKRQQQEEPAAPAVTARAGRHGTAVYASADANRAAAERGRPKVAAMQGRTMYRRLDGSLRPKNALDSLAEFVLAPFPMDVRYKIRRTARNVQRSLDEFLQRLGGGDPPALEGRR